MSASGDEADDDRRGGDGEEIQQRAHADAPQGFAVDFAERADLTVLTQGSNSGTGLIHERWLAQHGIHLPRILISHNLLVQVGLTLSGVGVSYLPEKCLSHLLERGVLQVIRTRPQLPPVRFFQAADGDGLKIRQGHLPASAPWYSTPGRIRRRTCHRSVKSL